MRRTLYILSRILLGAFLTVYIALALINYSLVQSLAGAWLGHSLSERSGGMVRVGSVSANLLDHAVLHDVLLVDPTGDTVSYAERIGVRFNKFPYRDNQLSFSYVSLRNAGFHLVSERGKGICLRYLLDLFNPDQPRPKGQPKPFELHIRTVVMHNLRYHHDLPGRDLGWEHGAVYHHLDFSRIEGRVTGLCVDERGRVTCRLHHLECHEVAGMNLHHIAADVDVGPQGIVADNFELTTDSSHMEADVHLLFRDWKTTRYWCDSVRMYVLFKPGTDLSMATAAYWAPTLWGMDSRARITGTVRGPVADMEIDHMVVQMGSATNLVVDGTVRGLPNIDSTRFDLRLNRLTTNYQDLCAVRHPDRMEPVRVLPLLEPMGHINAVATFEGRVADFRATLNASTEAGHLMADLAMRLDPRTHQPSYRGEITAPVLHLDKLAGSQWVSSTGLSLNVEGRGFDPRTMTAQVEGRLFATRLRGHPLGETTLDATLRDGRAALALALADSLLSFSLDGQADLSSRQPSCRLQGQVDRADLGAFSIGRAIDSILLISTHLDASASLDLDQPAPMESLVAKLDLSSTDLATSRGTAHLRQLALSAREVRHRKSLSIKSDLLDGYLRGYFRYEALPLIVRDICDRYAPLYYNPYADRQDEPVDYAPLADADLSLDLTWTDTRRQGTLLLPRLEIGQGTRLRAYYTFTQSLRLLANADSLRLGALRLHDIALDASDANGLYILNLNADRLDAGRSHLLDDLRVQMTSKPSLAACQLHWLDPSADTTRGDILLRMSSSPEGNHLTVGRNELLLHGYPWRLECPEGVRFAKGFLEVGDLSLQGQGQSLAMQASMSGSPDDHVGAEFRQFDLQQLQFLLAPIGFDLEGTTNGHVRLVSLASSPRIDADLSISALALNDQPMGNTKLLAHWSPDSNLLSIAAQSLLRTEAGPRRPFSAVGSIDMSSPDPGLDFALALERFDLQALAPLAESVASNLEGSLDGNISLSGTLAHPQLEGGLRLKEGRVLIDVNNVAYTIDDSLTLTPSAIRFDHFTLTDPYGNPAVIDGQVRHQGFREMELDLSLSSPNFCLLNTLQRGGDFYGSLFASASGRISGPIDDVSIDVDAVTQPGSQLYLPIDNQRQVKEASFITILSDEEEPYRPGVSPGTHQSTGRESDRQSNYHIDVNLTLTPDMGLALPVDFAPARADVTTTGQGDLHLSLSADRPLALLGTYEISTGALHLSLGGMVNKQFSIDPGSTLSFLGPLDATAFHIDAAYSTRVNLATLTGASSSSDHSAQTVNVEDVVKLSGTLSAPQIGFDIRLPNADPSVEEEVFSYIDRTNERDMLNQCLSLLVSGSFYNTANSTSLENSSASLIVNALGNVVSGMVSFVDLSFDYSAESEFTRRQFDVDINKDFGRFYLESTLGIGGVGELEGPQGNELTGDVLLGYKVSPNVHFFVFNRSNTNDYTRSEMPYKQGAGIKLTKDFDRLGDLFRKRQKGGKR